MNSTHSEKPSFIKLVRSGKIKQPTQRAFSVEKWQKEFERLKDPSLEDARIFEAGLWFFQRFESIRMILRKTPKVSISQQQLVRLFVAKANRLSIDIQSQMTNRLRIMREDAELEQAAKIPMEQINTMATITDGLRYPIASALHTPPTRIHINHTSDELASIVDIGLSTGIAYDLLETLWGECLWNDWHINTESEVDILTPNNIQREIERAVGNFREQSILAEAAAHISHIWSKLAISDRRLLTMKNRAIGMQKQRSIEKIVTGHIPINLSSPPLELMIRTDVTEYYFEKISDIKLPNIQNLTIRTLLDSWEVLSPLGNQLLKSTSVTNLAPVLERSDIEECLVKCLSLDFRQAKRILDMFIFRGTPSDEFWFRPFVPLDDKKLTFVASALSTPNLIRSVSYWLREAKIDIGQKGLDFEIQVRSDLKTNNRLSVAEVVENSVNFTVNDVTEEIDMIVRIGNTLLVGEMKCSSFPASPMDFHNYHSTLNHAVDQVLRKAQFIRSNLSEFFKLQGWMSSQIEATKILPVIITNNSVGAGTIINNVPVVDYRILKRYLNEGYIYRWSTSSIDDFKHYSEVRFYSNDVEAETNVQSYLASPPQISILHQMIKEVYHPIHKVDNQEKRAFFIQFEVEQPSEVSIE